MAHVRRSEQGPRRILEIFSEADKRSGDILMTGHLRKEFQAAGASAEDFAAALSQASKDGWIIDENVTVRLTDAGPGQPQPPVPPKPPQPPPGDPQQPVKPRLRTKAR